MFYYLVQDLKALIFSLISLHFKVGLTRRGWLLGAYTDGDTYTDQAHLNEYKNHNSDDFLGKVEKIWKTVKFILTIPGVH